MQKENRKYYEAYEDRYKTAHEKGVSWTQMKNTPIVMDIIKRYHLHPEQSLLEIGCGEGRDSATVLENGFHLIATDISPEANYSLQGTTQSRYLTGGVPPVRFSM